VLTLDQMAASILLRCERQGDCLVWTGARAKRGYGTFRPWPGAKTLSTHRTMLKWKLNGALSGHDLTLHSCDNRACCNPDHLRAGTATENTRDMVSRGRSRVGEKASQSRFADAQVKEFRHRVGRGETQASIARACGVNPSQVSRAVTGKTWAHLEGAEK